MVQRSQTGGRARFGALAVLAACFLASAIIRAGEVVAALPVSGEAAGDTHPPEAVDRLGGDGSSVEDMRDPESVIAELRRQRELLNARTQKMDVREQTLDALGAKLRERLAEIKAARKRLAETAALVDDAAGKDVRRLAVMYQQMKPKQAGRIFDRMAPSFAAGFIAEMRPDAAALILASMDAEKAYAVTLLLAGRNVKPVGGETAAGE